VLLQAFQLNREPVDTCQLADDVTGLLSAYNFWIVVGTLVQLACHHAASHQVMLMILLWLYKGCKSPSYTVGMVARKQPL
jgi:hypothetical protein